MHKFWSGKNVLVTGHTGFKGSWLSVWLLEMGANVIGYALNPTSDRDNFVLCGLSKKVTDIRGDIRDIESLKKTFDIYKPEIVFHLAAQPLVRYSYDFPKETYEINVMGTLNILECIRKSDYVKCGVMITTDKCYENKEQIWGYRECDPMGGYDPYSSSKACAELLISSYRNSFMNPNNFNLHNKAIASARAGNVIGGGDWSKDRIIPDCIRAIEAGLPIQIRNPKAIRPWQHVLEPLSGYLMLAEKLYTSPTEYAEAWNFGPNPESTTTVWMLCDLLINEYSNGVLQDISFSAEPHETHLLSLDNTKSRFRLGWTPRWSIEKTIKKTVEWYQQYMNISIYELCSKQITEYLTN